MKRTSSPSPNVRWVFDLDGVLVDTRPYVREAYRRVGVDIPNDAWGKPASEWLPDLVGPKWHAIHAAKNAAYERLFRMSHPQETSAGHAALVLDEMPEAKLYVLTGASTRAAVSVLGHVLPSVRWVDVITGCTRSMKLDRLTQLSRGYDVVFIDDDEVTCDAIRLPTVRVVRYNLEDTRTEDILDGCGDPSCR